MNPRENPETIKLFERLAAWTWSIIPLAAEEKISWGEQTLTEHLLLAIKLAGLCNVRVRQKPLSANGQESKTGLDWEWWIGSPGEWWRFAVQAKKLDWSERRYTKLNHKVDKEPQHEILERYATDNLAIPLYCLYNHVAKFVPQGHWRCCCEPPEIEQFGCTVTGLDNVKEALKTRSARTFDYFLRQTDTYPWRCLVKCPNKLRNLVAKRYGDKYQPLKQLPAEIERLRVGLAADDSDEPRENQLETHFQPGKIIARRLMVVTIAEEQDSPAQISQLRPLPRFQK